MKYFILIILIIFVYSCNNEQQNNDKIQIKFWHSFVSSTLPALDTLIYDFEKNHPQIKILAQYVPTGDALIQKLVTAIQSNTTPDISWIHSDFLHRLVDADAIYPMQKFIHGKNGISLQEMNDFFPSLLDAASIRDTLYAIPMEATTLALIYNRRLFREAGLDPESPPENWDELIEYAQKLTKDKNGDGIIDQYGFYVPVFPASGPLSIWMVLQWSPFLWQAGGQLIDKEQTRAEFDSDAGIAALSLWKDLFNKQVLVNFSQGHDSGFLSGMLAMIMDGPWNLPLYRSAKNTDWAIASLPAGKNGKVTYLAGEHLAIFRQSRFQNEAWSFVKYIIAPQTQAKFSKLSGYLPVRKSVLNLKEYQKYLETDYGLRSFVKQIPYSRGRERIDHFRVEINQAIAEAVEKSIMGGDDPKAALDDAAAEVNRLLAKEK